MQEIIDKFKHAIKKNRLSHLYLIYGSSGSHKIKLAKEIAFLIFQSENNQDNLKHLVDDLNYPNLFCITKEDKSVKKEQILNLQEEFSKTSLVKGTRIFIIDSIETMSQQAANSLLKFLEEPKGEKTIGFLITDNIQAILPTVLSRSQLIHINDEDENSFINLLKENGFTDIDAFSVSLATRSLEEAISILNDNDYQLTISLFTELLQLLSNNQDLGSFFFENQPSFYIDRKWILMFLRLYLLVYLDVLHVHLNQEVKLSFIKDSIMSIVTSTSAKQAELYIWELKDLISRIPSYINVGLAMQALAIKMTEIKNS